jgi:predicted O-methyltransferase YrrM
MSVQDNSLDFCPTLKEILATGYVNIGESERVAVSGTSTLNNISAIRHALKKEKPQKTMEIGLAYGASALTFLATHAELRQASSQHLAIDPYQSTSWRSAGVEAIRSAGLESNFALIEQDSALALPRLCTEGASFGMIYIDGSHIFEDVFVDFFYCARLLELNGLLLFDDCSDKHIKKVLRFVESNYRDILVKEDIRHSKTWKQRVGMALGIQQLTAYRKIGETPRAWNAAFSKF